MAMVLCLMTILVICWHSFMSLERVYFLIGAHTLQQWGSNSCFIYFPLCLIVTVVMVLKHRVYLINDWLIKTWLVQTFMSQLLTNHPSPILSDFPPPPPPPPLDDDLPAPPPECQTTPSDAFPPAFPAPPPVADDLPLPAPPEESVCLPIPPPPPPLPVSGTSIPSGAGNPQVSHNGIFTKSGKDPVCVFNTVTAL